MNTIADTLKYHRESNGLSQTQLAKATGVSQQKLSYYESGKHSPSIEDCILLADFYGISLDELVGRKD
jgi:transcriptional regulator with XRE-family HTH domain